MHHEVAVAVPQPRAATEPADQALLPSAGEMAKAPRAGSPRTQLEGAAALCKPSASAGPDGLDSCAGRAAVDSFCNTACSCPCCRGLETRPSIPHSFQGASAHAHASGLKGLGLTLYPNILKP